MKGRHIPTKGTAAGRRGDKWKALDGAHKRLGIRFTGSGHRRQAEILRGADRALYIPTLESSSDGAQIQRGDRHRYVLRGEHNCLADRLDTIGYQSDNNRYNVCLKVVHLKINLGLTLRLGMYTRRLALNGLVAESFQASRVIIWGSMGRDTRTGSCAPEHEKAIWLVSLSPRSCYRHPIACHSLCLLSVLFPVVRT